MRVVWNPRALTPEPREMCVRGVYACARNLVSEWVLNSGFIKRCFHHFSSLHHSHVRIQPTTNTHAVVYQPNCFCSCAFFFFSFVFCVCDGFRLDELSVVSLVELGTFFFLSLSFSVRFVFIRGTFCVVALFLCAFFSFFYFHFFCHLYFHCSSCFFLLFWVFPHLKLDTCTSVHNVLFKLN